MPSLLTSLTSPFVGTKARVVSLTLASILLLAAGEVSNSVSDRAINTSDDSILAPMTFEQAIAARAALAETLPTGVAAETSPTNVPAAAASKNTTAKPMSLPELVSVTAETSEITSDTDKRCLASAVYFESRGEPLEGQLAVAQAIINRVESGRYADSICGVINQPGQFSFDRRRSPSPGADWRTAQAIAKIATDDMWHDVAPRAISFHASRLSPGWKGKIRIAQIGNHVFYR